MKRPTRLVRAKNEATDLIVKTFQVGAGRAKEGAMAVLADRPLQNLAERVAVGAGFPLRLGLALSLLGDRPAHAASSSTATSPISALTRPRLRAQYSSLMSTTSARRFRRRAATAVVPLPPKMSATRSPSSVVASMRGRTRF